MVTKTEGMATNTSSIEKKKSGMLLKAFAKSEGTLASKSLRPTGLQTELGTLCFYDSLLRRRGSATRKNTIHKGSALICKECRARGCTPRSPELYTCTTCRKMFGAAQMDTISFTNFKHHGRPTLTCGNCVSAQKNRLKTLQTQLRKSNRKCTCFRPFHKPLCPLTPCRYNEQRWPESDSFISMNEKDLP